MHTEIANFGAKDIMSIPWEKYKSDQREYIENQLKADKEADQMSLYDLQDPFSKGK